MKKIILIIAILFGNLQSINAQCEIIGKEVITKDFPKVEFTIQNKNPEILSENQFKLFESEGAKEIRVEELSVEHKDDEKSYIDENKCVYILIESLNIRARKMQLNDTYKAISSSFSNVISGDLVKVAAFDLRRGGNIILQDINSEFTDNKSTLTNAVDNFTVKNDHYSRKDVSDVYGALLAAIEELSKLDTDFPKSIVLISEEKVNDKSTQTATDVIKIAKEKGIIIHTIKYNKAKYGVHKIESLSIETYGGKKSLNRDGNAQKRKDIISFMDDMFKSAVKRSKGQNYKVIAKLNTTIKDGKENTINLVVNDENRLKIKFKNPGNWVVAQFQQHLIIAIIVSILLLALLLILLLFIINKQKKKKELQQRRIYDQQQIESQQEEELSKQRQELNNLKEEDQRRLEEKEDLNREGIRLEDKNRLIKEMKSIGRFPILKVVNSGKELQYEINTPHFSVGREQATNLICVPNNNISRNHFIISYSEKNYTIKDNKSTNGIIINGYKIKDAILNHGDIIQIGDVTFTFYK